MIEEADIVTDSRKNLYNDLKIAGISAYFLILFIERLLALIFSPNCGGAYAFSAKTPFNYVAYAITAASLCVGTGMFLRLFFLTVRAIRGGERRAFGWKANAWCAASTALLFGGMMHTGYTLLWLQFIGYAFLIGAMIIRCIEACADSTDRFIPIVATIYLILYSMSIPVCYLSFMESPLHELFYVAQFTTVAILVPSFGIMFARLMRTGEVLFSPSFAILLFLLSGATIALRWTEQINWFLLIMTALTILFYLTCGLTARRRQIARRQL